MQSNLRETGTIKTDGKVITGTALTFEPYHLIDDVWEHFLPTCISPDTLQKTVACFNHNEDRVLASVENNDLKFQITPQGLEYEFAYDADDDDHRHVNSKMRKGLVKTSSFRFHGAKDSWRREGDKRIRTIHSIKNIVEVSPMVRAANGRTKAGIRGANDFPDVFQSWETWSRLQFIEEIKNNKTI